MRLFPRPDIGLRHLDPRLLRSDDRPDDNVVRPRSVRLRRDRARRPHSKRHGGHHRVGERALCIQPGPHIKGVAEEIGRGVALWSSIRCTTPRARRSARPRAKRRAPSSPRRHRARARRSPPQRRRIAIIDKLAQSRAAEGLALGVDQHLASFGCQKCIRRASLASPRPRPRGQRADRQAKAQARPTPAALLQADRGAARRAHSRPEPGRAGRCGRRRAPSACRGWFRIEDG